MDQDRKSDSLFTGSKSTDPHRVRNTAIYYIRNMLLAHYMLYLTYIPVKCRVV